MKKRIGLFIGGDELQQERTIAAVIKKLYGDQDVDRMIYYASEGQAGRAIEEVLSFSLFSTEKVVILKELDKLGKGKEDEEEGNGGKSAYDVVIEYVEQPRGDTPLLLFSDNKKLPKRLLDAIGKDAIKELKATTDAQIKDEALRRSKEEGITLAPETIRYLIDQCGQDVTSALTELDKLMAWAEEGQTVTLEDCRTLIRSTHEDKVWGLVDWVAKHDIKSALEFYIQLFEQGEEPIAIISFLAASFRKMLLCRTLAEENIPDKEWPKRVGMSGFPLKMTIEKSKQFSIKGLRHGIHLLRCADEDAKGGKSDRFLMTERLVMDLCRLPKPKAKQ